MRESLKGHVDVLLLSALEAGPAHGYRLAETIRERSAGDLDLAEGTLYPALYRLERRRLVVSSWVTVGGRRRRVYRLTGTGRAELERKRADWWGFARAMEAVLA